MLGGWGEAGAVGRLLDSSTLHDSRRDVECLSSRVRDLDALDALCDATAERFGGIDIVVPNAGVGAYGPFLELSREHLDEMLDVNLKGTALRDPSRAAAHAQAAKATWLTLASEAGRRGLPRRGGLLRARSSARSA